MFRDRSEESLNVFKRRLELVDEPLPVLRITTFDTDCEAKLAMLEENRKAFKASIDCPAYLFSSP